MSGRRLVNTPYPEFTIESLPALTIPDILEQANKQHPRRQLGKCLVWNGKEPSVCFSQHFYCGGGSGHVYSSNAIGV